MSVRVEKNGAVTTVILSRADVRNAVDREHADALAEAFRRFEADDGAHVAVLFGEGGNFCAGADLKAMAAGNPNRVEPSGDAPMGPTRYLLRKPVIAAVAGYAVAGGLELACWCACAWSKRTRSSASFAVAGACHSSTAAPCACRG